MDKPVIIKYKKDDSVTISIVAGTHGDEIVGLEVINKLRARVERYLDKGTVQFIIANPLAVSMGLRYVYKNLNTQTFPGDENGNYEDKLAFELTNILEESDYVIDLHSTTHEIDPYVIVRNTSEEIINFAKLTNFQKIVYYPIDKLTNKTLIDYGKCSIAFEIGPHRSEEAFEVYTSAVFNVLINLGFLRGNGNKSNQMKLFEYFGGINELDQEGLSKIQNFKLVKKGTLLGKDYSGNKVIAKEDFIPFLKTERNANLVFSCARLPILV